MPGHEAVIVEQVRADVAERDGHCRLFTYDQKAHALFGSCDGPSEWAHLEDSRRAHTRGQEPEDRHTTEGTAMLCRRHHRAYDAYQFGAAFLTRRGADGPMLWYTKTDFFAEGIRR